MLKKLIPSIHSLLNRKFGSWFSFYHRGNKLS